MIGWVLLLFGVALALPVTVNEIDLRRRRKPCMRLYVTPEILAPVKDPWELTFVLGCPFAGDTLGHRGWKLGFELDRQALAVYLVKRRILVLWRATP